MKPNFMIVGAPKSGTTSLQFYLSEHPEVFMSTPKEVNYFSHSEIEQEELYYKDFRIETLSEYEKLFDEVSNEKAIGEASVSYLFYPKIPYKIKKTIPNAKIIILLRDPVSRSYSHYLMDERLGYVDVDFDRIIFNNSKDKLLSLYYQQYVELGYYFQQVKRYLDVFGKENVGVYIFDDLTTNPQNILNQVYILLEIEKIELSGINKRHNAYMNPKNSLISHLYHSHRLRIITKRIMPDLLIDRMKKTLFKIDQKPTMSERILEYLSSLYIEDIQLLEKLIDKDLSCWYNKYNN